MTAAAKVFRIPELGQKILEHLDAKDLVSCLRVNKDFNASLTKLITFDKPIRTTLHIDNNADGPVSRPPVCPPHIRIGQFTTQSRLFVHNARGDLLPKALTAKIVVVRGRIYLDLLKEAKGWIPWEKVHVTQPLGTAEKNFLIISEATENSRGVQSKSNKQRINGVTYGKITEMAQAMLEDYDERVVKWSEAGLRPQLPLQYDDYLSRKLRKVNVTMKECKTVSMPVMNFQIEIYCCSKEDAETLLEGEGEREDA